MSTPLRVRFCPAPSGWLHVGGARTALFNWLWARRHGGTFVLRIEDTDAARATLESAAGMMQALDWRAAVVGFGTTLPAGVPAVPAIRGSALWKGQTRRQAGLSEAHEGPRWTYRVTHEGSAMSEASFTFRVDEALKNAFAAAAKARDRTGAQLLRDFMREFVQKQQEVAEHDAWFRRQVQAGLDSADAGRLVPATEVEARFGARRAATRRRLEASK